MLFLEYSTGISTGIRKDVMHDLEWREEEVS